MQGNRIAVSVHVGGTLAANQTGVFVLPCDATLEHVSACQSNAGAATLMFGTVADPDGFKLPVAIGVSNVPTSWGRADFMGALVPSGNGALSPLPRLVQGTAFSWTLDFDGAAGTAGQNVSLLFTFLEG